MSNCAACGCAPCNCAAPSFLNEARLFDPIVSGGVFTGGTFNGPTINDGTSNGQQINNATIDCSTTVCTQPNGTCDDTIASTAFVCDAISDAISGTNPDFCNAVNSCLGIVGTFCDAINICINTTPGVISDPAAFDPSVYATTTIYGVTRYATLAEVQAADCELAIDPCTLGAFWSAGGPNPLWTAFEAAVNSAITGGAVFCANVFACGVQASASLCADVAACGFASLASPVLTGNPTAPTPAPGDNDTSIATTAFVTNAITTAISALNPAFCAAVTACGGGGGGGGGGAGVYASCAFDLTITENGGIMASLVPVYSNGMTVTAVPLQLVGTWPGTITFTLGTALGDDNYEISWSEDQLVPVPAPGTQFTAPKPLFANQVGASFDWTVDPTAFTCGGAPCTQTRRIHVAVLSAVGAIPCAVIQASFTNSAVALPAATRILAADCNAYTAQQIINQTGLQGVVFATGSLTWSPVVTIFTRGCSFVNPIVTFNVLQPDTNYSVVFGGFDWLDAANYHAPLATLKTTSGFTITLPGSGPGFVGAGSLDFAVVR